MYDYDYIAGETTKAAANVAGTQCSWCSKNDRNSKK